MFVMSLSQTNILQRTKILRSSGTDPNLIQYLLNDAQLLEILTTNLTKQIENLQSFRIWYQSEPARALHETPLDEVKARMAELEEATHKLQATSEERLRNLNQASQNMIQLVLSVCSAPMGV